MKRICLFLLCLCLMLSGCGKLQSEADNNNTLEVHYIDVGQADCTFLRCNGQTMLIDGGNAEDSDLVVSYLLNQNVKKLDYVVNTHAHEDHVGGLPGVLAVFEVGAVWCPVTEYSSSCFEDFAHYADQQYLKLTMPEIGSTYALGEAEITVLGPVKDYEETNDTSIVLRVDHGSNAFLFTGDAEAAAEKDILEYGMDVASTVLKVGHHGSDTSTCYQWLREVSPQYAVISVGEDNSYGHPHEVILSRLRDAGVTVYRTDLQGHIVCLSNGETVTFSTNKDVPVTNPTEKTEYYIGNKNSQKLHLPTCSGVPKAENQVVFFSYDLAVAFGYTPCSICLG